MGTDIHFVIEKKTKNHGWVGIYSTQNVPISYEERWKTNIHQLDSRNYTFFGALAGIRREGPAPIGLPPDASTLTLVDVEQWDEDGHSHSHCSLYDFVAKYLQSNDITEAVAQKLTTGKNPIHAFLEKSAMCFYDEDEDNIDDYRVCFWFDN